MTTKQFDVQALVPCPQCRTTNLVRADRLQQHKLWAHPELFSLPNVIRYEQKEQGR